MTSQDSGPKRGSMPWRWQAIARRIRVPLGFLAAALYLFELWRRAPHPAAVAWSLALVLPGLLLRGYAAGYVKKNRELTTTGPYAHTRNPLYLGSLLMAAGFALALLNGLVAAVLAIGFAAVYIPVIAAEESFLRGQFPQFEAYRRAVPRLLPRLTPARLVAEPAQEPTPAGNSPAAASGLSTADFSRSGFHASGFSWALYRKHREYNAVLGTALLYFSLLALHPALAAILGGAGLRAR
jgi:protein-S-isoprenylcysteine O-methyltransferase Ste14